MGWINHLTVPALAKYNLVSIFEAHCAWVIADRTEYIFPLQRESSDGRIYREYKIAYIPSRPFLGLNSPRELIERLMSIKLIALQG